MDNSKPHEKNSKKTMLELSSSSEKSPAGAREQRIFKLLRLTAETCGANFSAEALTLMVADLQQYPEEQIFAGLKRCREEIKPEKGFVKLNLALLLEKMGVKKGADLKQSQARRQWEALNKGLCFYGDTPGCYWVGDNPQLSEKGHAALRRIGGMAKLEHWAKESEWHFTERAFLNSYEDHEDIGFSEEHDELESEYHDLLAEGDQS